MVSIASNSLVIHVVRVNPHMHSTTNYFIVNMSAADLLATVFTSSNAMKTLQSGFRWSSGVIGVVSCKGNLFLMTTCLMCSIFSLVAITFDRFMAVIRPITYKYCSWWAKYIIPAVWIASLAISFPLAFLKMQVGDDFLANNKTYCFMEDAADEGIAVIVLGFIAPHVVMVIMYSMISYKLWKRRLPGEQRDDQRNNVAQTAKKVTRMMVCVVLVFDICMAPLFTVFTLPFLFNNKSWMHTSYTSTLSSLFTTSNGFLNALVYAFFNENYRRAFCDTLGLLKIRNWLGRKTERIRNFVSKRNRTANFTVNTQPD
ncbi:tachykinin-like peptides receptor 86C [Actinia tenebrosa]|uniref:Tachykinin-like peptides receptor 86C n=1 Tax=Actinia tenebrosa TaxID=6105 RepID=A0A6P8I238_ACTTE|nr:tachykinin-like peptides receptor 86C [Actinia tenebrosa]